MSNYIICPIRNCIHLTRAAVKTFLNQDIKGGVEVLLFDNASTDGTYQWAKSMYPRVRVIKFLEPQSVSYCWNIGLGVAFDRLDPDRIMAGAWQEEAQSYALVCNNDVELRPDTYMRLVEDGGGFVTGVGVSEREKIRPVPIGSEAPGREFYMSAWPPPDPALKRPHPDFSCFLIRKWVWDKVGPFDENFKGAMAEDWDYHVRLHKAGIEAYCMDLPFLHVGGGSQTIKNAPEKEAREIADRAGENREYFRRKWGFEGGSEEYYNFFKKSWEEDTV